MNKLILLLPLFFLGGCATVPSELLNGSIEPPVGMAYAIVSVTGISVNPNSTHLEVRYRGVNNSEYGSIHVDLFRDTIFSRVVGGPTTEGKVALLRLAPGSYRFDGAYGSFTEEQMGGRIYFFPFSSEFQLADKQTAYLGEIKLDLSLRPEVVISDQQTRDLSHVERMWLIKDVSPIKIKVILRKP